MVDGWDITLKTWDCSGPNGPYARTTLLADCKGYGFVSMDLLYPQSEKLDHVKLGRMLCEVGRRIGEGQH